MKYKILITVCMSFSASPVFARQSVVDCGKPSILRIVMKGSTAYYQLDDHLQHKLFTLGEVSAAARSCSPERQIVVVTDYNVPLSFIQLPGKEQIGNARYFVQGRNGAVQELHFGPRYKQLPVTPDIAAEPNDDDLQPKSPTATPRGK